MPDHWSQGGGGAEPPGSDSLQVAYNDGNTIVETANRPVAISSSSLNSTALLTVAFTGPVTPSGGNGVLITMASNTNQAGLKITHNGNPATVFPNASIELGGATSSILINACTGNTNALQPSAGGGNLFTKTAGGVTDLYYISDTGVVTQITPGGGGGGVTLDAAYDFGGAGAGRAIVADAGAVSISSNASDNNNILEISKIVAGAQSGAGVSVQMGNNCTGSALLVNNLGGGYGLDLFSQGAGGVRVQNTSNAAILITSTAGAGESIDIVHNAGGAAAIRIGATAANSPGVLVTMGASTNAPALQASAAGTGVGIALTMGAASTAAGITVTQTAGAIGHGISVSMDGTGVGAGSALVLAGGSQDGVTGSPPPLLDMSATWNNGVRIFTGIKFNATNTASNVASRLLGLDVGNVSQYSLYRDGGATMGAPAGGDMGPASLNVAGNLYVNGTAVATGSPTLNGITNATTGQFAWSSGSGAITHILGPSDQPFTLATASNQNIVMSPNGSGVVFINAGGASTGAGLEVSGVPVNVVGNFRYNLEIHDTTSAVAGDGGGIMFSGFATGTSVNQPWANISGIKENNTSGDPNGALVFRVGNFGDGFNERWRIESSGALRAPGAQTIGTSGNGNLTLDTGTGKLVLTTPTTTGASTALLTNAPGATVEWVPITVAGQAGWVPFVH